MKEHRTYTRWFELGSGLIGLLLVLGYAGSVFAAGATCTSTGRKNYKDPSQPKQPRQAFALICSGGCQGPPATACIFVASTTQGGQPGATCGCAGQLPPTCCHLVGIGPPPPVTQPPTPYKPSGIAVGGTCPPCPANGDCVRAGDGSETDAFQPECKP